jgi:general stress protein 26
MNRVGSLLLAAGIALGGSVTAPQDETMLRRAAREIIESARFCALITLDEGGAPAARMMDPFPPTDDLVVWMGTNAGTRKVADLRRDPRATLYCHDVEAGAYVSLRGLATVVTDPEEKARHWKQEWRDFYDDEFRGADYALIRLAPEVAEIISMKHGIATDPKGFAPAVLRLR